MQRYERALSELLAEISSQPHRSTLDEAVTETLKSFAQSESSSENWKGRWEYSLRETVFKLSVRVKMLLKRSALAHTYAGERR